MSAAESSHHAEARAFRALHEIAVAIAGVLDAGELARLVTSHARDLLDADGAVLHLWDADSGTLVELDATTIDGGMPRGLVLRLGEGIAGQAALQRAILTIEDYQNWPGAVPVALQHGLRSAVALPLVVADRLIGVLAARFSEPRSFSEQFLQLLSLLAAQVAPALDAARMHAIQGRLLARERALVEVNRALASDLDETRVLELAVRHGARLVGAPFASVWLQGETNELRCAAVLRRPETGSVHPSSLAASEGGSIGQYVSADSLIGLSLDHAVVNLPDATTHPAWQHTAAAVDPGLRGYLAVAIRRASTTLGVLLVMRPDAQAFAEEDAALLARLADAVAVAVANARALASVAASEQQLRSTYAAIACGILVQAADGTILNANGMAEAIFGYTIDQMRGRRSSELWRVMNPDGTERPQSQRRTAQAAADGQPQHNFTTCIIRPDGEWRWLQGNAVPLQSADGRTQVVSSFIDVTESKRAEHALEHQALHDALTGLPNRVLLRDRLEQAVRSAQRSGTPVALLLMDLDRFKEVNDTLGHDCGDVLLRQVASRLARALRGSDTVARLGGDEFAVLLPGADAAAAAQVGQELLRVLQAPIELEGQSVDIGASVGLAVFPEHGDDPDTLLRRADVAMYVAKRAGGGCATYDAALDEHTPSRLTLMSELRQAIESDQLVVHYQPKLEVSSGRAVGVEALLRWQHPWRGLLGPNHFIPFAEQIGYIGRLTRWVLEAAVRQARAWQRAGYELSVAVNLSMRDLRDPHLASTIAELLASTGLPPRLLQLELTESTLMADPEHAIQVLSALRKLGVQVAIDDFGTGYSSMALLKRLPVDALKIDRAFVREVATDRSDQAIVRATIELAHSLGLHIVAEGVEDAESLAVLAELGCDEAQGYYFSRPLPRPELNAWLAEVPARAA